jgi:hypothetical protein
MVGVLEKLLPEVATGPCLTEKFGSILFSKPTPHYERFIPVDPAFALLQVDRIRRQTPMDDTTAIPMEVQAFLAYLRRTKREESAKSKVMGQKVIPGQGQSDKAAGHQAR